MKRIKFRTLQILFSNYIIDTQFVKKFEIFERKKFISKEKRTLINRGNPFKSLHNTRPHTSLTRKDVQWNIHGYSHEEIKR